jgi:tetratricopeptide (TPR) repeat protein
LLDFEVSGMSRAAASRSRDAVLREIQRPAPPSPDLTAAGGEFRPLYAVPAPADAGGWYERGVELEADDPEEAIAAYRRAAELAPDLADAHINLGRLLHERGELAAAELRYRQALAARPGDSTAHFNLGVALQDLGRLDEAASCYAAALAADPTLADAHYNLATVYEQLGRHAEAFQHLRTYRALTAGAPR